MMSDRDIAALITSSLGYKTTVGPVDKAKVEAEAAGERRKYPSAKLAQAAVELYRRQPPVVQALSPVWQADAVFTSGGLSNFNGAPRAAALARGWTVAYVQLANTPYANANELELARFAAEGWTLVGWATYGQGDRDPEEEGREAAGICKRITVLRGWKANGEAWAEGPGSWKTAAFLKGWRAGGAPVPLGWSVLSSVTASFPRDFDYPTALSVAGADVDVQAYGATDPRLTVGAANGMLDKTTVPPGRRAISFDIDGNGTGPFGDYLTWKGPRRLWHPDKATVDTFTRLAR